MLKLGIIGWPLGYSLSPLMHRAALKAAGLQGAYDEIKVRPEDLAGWLEREAPKLDGFNVTMPHKEVVYRWLLNRVGMGQNVDPTARLIGAVNTVTVKEGCLKGWNTDGQGFIGSVDRTVPGFFQGSGSHGKSVLLLGAGGSAAAIALTLVSKGSVGSLLIWNRHAERARDLALRITGVLGHQAIRFTDRLDPSDLGKFELIINATPTGMNKHEETPVDCSRLRKGQAVVDIVYDPLETRLIHGARQQGCTVIRGDEMLAGQGAAAFEIWTGVPAAQTLPVMKGALNDHFAAAA